jgi:hypothetical protein
MPLEGDSSMESEPVKKWMGYRFKIVGICIFLTFVIISVTVS